MFIRSFKHVYIHPRCKSTIREFQLYSWKVDRLSGDVLPELVDAENHWCIAEGQRVLTKRGLVPIETVDVGDMVMTRNGWRRVLVSQMTSGAASVVSVETTLGTLTCTPDHPIYSGGRFVRADALSYGDDVTGDAEWLKQLNGAAGRIEDGRTQSKGLIGFIFSAAQKAVSSIFTAPSGNITRQTSTRKRKLVVGHVLTVTAQEEKSRVYNLLIECENEFIAEGVLSHNCDALRYALEPIMRRGKVSYTSWV